MWLEYIKFQGFRNLEDNELGFEPGFYTLVGPNGSGKTNFLEAVYYLATGHSFRGMKELDLKHWDAQFLRVKGGAQAHSGEVRCGPEGKEWFRDGVKLERWSDYLGWLPVVFSSLGDIELVVGGPAKQRRFLDRLIAQVDRRYLSTLFRYRRALMQRNRILKDHGPDDELEGWDEELVESGSYLFKERFRACQELLADATQYYQGFGFSEPVKFSYEPAVQGPNWADSFRAGLLESRAQDRRFGFTLLGPHRDRIGSYKLGSNSLEDFGSEGEERIGALALRLAEARYLNKLRAEPVILLLDEVTAELDQSRARKLLEAAQGLADQIFYASVREEKWDKVLHVAAGKIA